MNHNHTPGPWEWINGALKSVRASRNLATIIDDESCRVIRDSDLEACEMEQAANKYLLAAAPDLLAACDAALDAWAKVPPDILARLQPLDDALSLVFAAADKAAGWGEPVGNQLAKRATVGLIVPNDFLRDLPDTQLHRGYTVEGLPFEFRCHFEPGAPEGAAPQQISGTYKSLDDGGGSFTIERLSNGTYRNADGDTAEQPDDVMPWVVAEAG